MAVIDKTQDATKTICWGRGDSSAKGFVMQDSLGAARNVTGFNFKLTVNAEKAPADQVKEQFTIVGVLVDAPNGKVSFAPTITDTDISPATYFYDIEQIDGSGAKDTLIIGKALIVQDITKV